MTLARFAGPPAPVRRSALAELIARNDLKSGRGQRVGFPRQYGLADHPIGARAPVRDVSNGARIPGGLIA